MPGAVMEFGAARCVYLISQKMNDDLLKFIMLQVKCVIFMQ